MVAVRQRVRCMMATSWQGAFLLGLAAADGDVDVDEAAQHLVAHGVGEEALDTVEEFVEAMAWDPSVRDRTLLLVERTRLLADRGSRGARRSAGLRADAARARASQGTSFEGLGGVWRHELSTPLAATELAVETLANHRDDAAIVEQMLGVARRNLRLAHHLLQGLGSLEDLRSGRVELSWARVDLVELVRECADDVREVLAGRHEIDVVVGQAVEVPADREAVHQILVNLLTNAAKFSPTDSPIGLLVSATPQHAEVAVSDRGRGLAPQDAERIFQAGQRLDDEAPGMGLGLFVARQLARAHGGELSVEHPSAGGARFVLRLPRSPAEWQSSLERREEAGTARDAGQRRRTATADARDDTLAEREAVADQRDAALADREAMADERDAEPDRRDDA
jgi:signal transduction histidine kinase